MATTRPVIIVELLLDRCDNEWGDAPCTAAGDAPCYRTRCTCQDATNYSASSVTYRFTLEGQPVPVGVQAYPCVSSVSHIPTRIDFKNGLGRGDQLSVECADFEDYGELLDPYWARRDTHVAASFFSRLKRLNKHYARRTMRVLRGEVDVAGVPTTAVSGWSTQTYVLEKIDGPSSGRVSISCQDLLSVLDTTQVPRASTGELNAALNSTDAAFSVVSGDGSQYGSAPFTIRVDDEIMTVGARSTDAFSSVSRGQWGTTAAAHDQYAKVQICLTWSAADVDDVWVDILEAAGIATASIDTTTAAEEVDLWVAISATGCISQPTKAGDLTAALAQQYGLITWWDAESQLCKLHGIHPLMPDDTITEIDDNAHIVGRSVRIEERDEERISRLDCYYGVRDWSKSLTEPDNYLRRVLAIDGSAEDTAEYDEVRDARQLFCYFTGSTSEAELDATAQRILARFRDAPRRIRFETVSEYAASIKPGQLVSLMARELVNDDGEPYSVACWVVSKARKSDIVWSFECIQDSDQTSARWWYWNSETAPAYDSATDEEKLCAFWADDATEKVGDDAPYCWI
jgi:hypothetical protein